MKRTILICIILSTMLSEARKDKTDPHPVPWEKMNDLFGIELWKDTCLWDDSTDSAAKRMKMKKESKTDFMDNYRTYPLGRNNVLTEPMYTAGLYGKTEHVDSLSFVFLNLGDMPIPSGTTPTRDDLKEIARKIETCGENIHDAITAVLGEAERDTIGKGNMREKVWRWDWNEHAILLTTQEGKYVILRMIPIQRADSGGKVDKIKGTALRERMASCIEREENGDVVISNIPMINQGPKGYCAPATWERYLRYLNIPADMYQLALVANTGIGGGTYADDMIDATKRLLSVNGRKLQEIGSKLEIRTIAKYIDRGMPIMWHFVSTPAFQMEANYNTARRKGDEIDEKTALKWARYFGSGSDSGSGSGGHVCLITGYNDKTGEMAISDSWGPQFTRRWISINKIEDHSYSRMNVIKW